MMIKKTIQTITLYLFISPSLQACPPEWVLVEGNLGPYWASSTASPQGGSRYLARYSDYRGAYSYIQFVDNGVEWSNWFIICDENPEDCKKILDDIDNDRVPTRPPAAVDKHPGEPEPWMPGTPKNPPEKDKETKKDSNGCAAANEKNKAASSEYAKKVIKKTRQEKMK